MHNYCDVRDSVRNGDTCLPSYTVSCVSTGQNNKGHKLDKHQFIRMGCSKHIHIGHVLEFNYSLCVCLLLGFCISCFWIFLFFYIPYYVVFRVEIILHSYFYLLYTLYFILC